MNSLCYTDGCKRILAKEIFKLGPTLQWRIEGPMANRRDISWGAIIDRWGKSGPNDKIAYETVDRTIVKFHSMNGAWYEGFKLTNKGRGDE